MFKRLRAAVDAAAFTFAGFANTGRPFALAPTYLAHLLWLLDQKFETLAKEAYAGNAAAYACLRLLSQSVPEPPMIPYRMLPDGEPGDPLDWHDPLRQLIAQPNPLLTEFEFQELRVLYLGIAGRGYWYKERNNLGQVIALWPLRPDRVGPIYGSPADAARTGNSADGVLLGWSYLIPGSSHYEGIARDNVMVDKFPDPSGETGGLAEGLGPMQVLAAEVGADNEATRFVGSLVNNYAMPGLVIEIADELKTLDQAKIIKQSFIQQFGGARRGEPAVVGSNAKLAQLGFSLKDLEFPALRMHTETRISAAFGVPAILVGLEAGIKQGVQATIDEMRDHFTETTLTAYWRRLSDTFAKSVANDPLSRFGGGKGLICRFDTSKVRAFAAQAGRELQQFTVLFEKGAVTINEIRDLAGLPARADGEVYIWGIAGGYSMQHPVPAGLDESDQVNLANVNNAGAVKKLEDAAAIALEEKNLKYLPIPPDIGGKGAAPPKVVPPGVT
jgi:HK97 family phage portal protein